MQCNGFSLSVDVLSGGTVEIWLIYLILQAFNYSSRNKSTPGGMEETDHDKITDLNPMPSDDKWEVTQFDK